MSDEVQALTEERSTLRMALAQTCEQHALAISLLADEVREQRLELEQAERARDALQAENRRLREAINLAARTADSFLNVPITVAERDAISKDGP